MGLIPGTIERGADPNLAYLLLVLGLIAIAIELVHPGINVSGILGALMVVGAGILLARLPVNAAGIVLVVTGVALMVAEAFLPGGIAGTIGLAGVIVGGLYLFDASSDVRVSRGLVAGTGLVVAGFAIFVVNVLVRSRRDIGPARDPRDLLGEEAVVERALDPIGVVRARNESWTARSAAGAVAAGARVRVTAVDGLTLEVEPDDEGADR